MQVDLHRQGIEDLPTALVVVDGLVDFKSTLSSGNGIKNKDDNKGIGKTRRKTSRAISNHEIEMILVRTSLCRIKVVMLRVSHLYVEEIMQWNVPSLRN